MNNRRTGTEKERLAAGFLVSAGYEILCMNFRAGPGEIDIIAHKDGIICFIEVKYRSSLKYGSPAEAVDIRKQRTIIVVSSLYLQKYGLWDREVRYDVVEILQDRIKLIENAFTL